MKIVILDGYSMNPGDLSWDSFTALGDIDIFPRTKQSRILERSKEADIVVINDVSLSKETISLLPNLKFICITATGYDQIDLEQAKKQRILVSNSPGYSTYSVAQSAIALLLHLTQHVKDHADAVRQGEWENSEDVCFWKYPLIELYQKKLGIIGMGAIGSQTAKIAQALGMQIQAYSPRARTIEGLETLQWIGIRELFETSDVLSLHCPLTEETRGIINKKHLAMMKNSAFIINTARGALIIEKDLAEALTNELIAGAALDVLKEEPPHSGSPLIGAKNCFITPHNAWATKEARKRLMEISVKNITGFLHGAPVNIVN
jgi:glycerate dehydrogenase